MYVDVTETIQRVTTPLDERVERLEAERDRLQQALVESEFNEQMVDAYQAELNALRRELSIAPPTQKVVAKVIARPPYLRYDTLLIDQGSDAGVAIGDLVVSRKTALGRIVAVYPDTAFAVLFSAPGETMRAMLTTNATPTSVVLEGQGAGNFLTRTARDVTLATTSVAYLPGSPGYLLGEVGQVVAQPTDTEQTVRLQYPFNLNDITYVGIVDLAYEYEE